ncbi:MAG: hypothetical protein GF383_14335 [Candidatus Lokiarchaeota archaeon]|nr:hypothetical protein [Candidatus Lokiarchaeota archaeon]MBD3342569.1 hypothetical protein [Candidatus Lokiarchaeota archaeon]
MGFSKEEVEILAYRRYISDESYDKSVWYLAELCCLINKNVQHGDEIKPLETDNLVLLLKENVNGKLLEANREEIKKLAEVIYNEHPEKSKLHWFIAEKSLLLKQIKDIISRNKE